MNTNKFWTLINKSNQQNFIEKEKKAKYLSSSLAEMEIQDIYDFEKILRRKIYECDDFKIIAAMKIIEGSVSDDPYLYFRCWLIGKGQKIFKGALEHPDSLTEYMDRQEIPDFEELLYVADIAYSKKTGKEEDDTFPRSILSCEKDLNYDFNPSPPNGDDWVEEELPLMYPNLWQLFEDY